jgi:hypothetical protein
MKMLRSGWHWRSSSGPTTAFNGDMKVTVTADGVVLTFGPVRHGGARHRVQVCLSGTELGQAFDRLSQQLNAKHGGPEPKGV